MKPTAKGKNWELYLGDCRNVLPHLGKVDAVVTDPPYGLDFDYNSYEDTRSNLRSLIDSTMPLIRSISTRVVVLPGITQVFLYPEPDWIASIVWDTTGTFGKFGYGQWMPVLIYGKDVDGFGNVNGLMKTDVMRIRGGGGSAVGFMRKSKEKEGHPCPKPLNVMSWLVRRLSNKGNCVCDPYMGSGTTGVACIQTGRKFIGIEIDPDYFAIAEKRISKAFRNQPFLD